MPAPTPSGLPDHVDKPSPSTSSGNAFATYRTEIEAVHADTFRRLSRPGVLIAFLLSLAAVCLAFAPWVAYQNRQEQDAFRRGIENDGLVLAVAAAIAVVALGFAWVRGPGEGAFEVLLALAANVVGFIAAGFTWMNITSFAIDDYKDPSKIHADWGVMAATLASALAAVACFRLWWTIRKY
jgi:cytochrome bd-type quinol oxidase subunit 2